MSDTTRYLLGAGYQQSYDRFAQADEPERLESELALARALCEQAVNAGQHALAAHLLGVIAKLSSATTAQKVRFGELLEKAAAMRLGRQLVDLVCAAITDKFDGWEDTMAQLADQVVVAIEQTTNEEPERKLLEGPSDE